MKIYYFAWKNGKKTDENRKQEWTELTAKEYKEIYESNKTCDISKRRFFERVPGAEWVDDIYYFECDYLSKYLFPDREEYTESYGRTTTKKILNWLESHSDPAKTTLKDLICTESMSMEEMLYVFDFLSQSFYHSDEYNSRKYLYGSIRELSYMTDHV